MILDRVGTPKQLARAKWCPNLEDKYGCSFIALAGPRLSDIDRANACLMTAIMRLSKMTLDHDIQYEVADIMEVLALLYHYTTNLDDNQSPDVPALLHELTQTVPVLQHVDGTYDLMIMPIEKGMIQANGEEESAHAQPTITKS